MSSRNAYLTPSERSSARALSRALAAAVELWQGGEEAADALLDVMRREIDGVDGVVADYIAAVEPRWLTPVMRAGRGVILMLRHRSAAPGSSITPFSGTSEPHATPDAQVQDSSRNHYVSGFELRRIAHPRRDADRSGRPAGIRIRAGGERQ